MFVIDDIIKGVFDLAGKGMELGKPGQAQTPLDYQAMQNDMQQSFGELHGGIPSEGRSNYVEQTRSEMKEPTPAASVGGAPIGGGAMALSDMAGPLPVQATPVAPQDAPMPGALAGQAADARAFEDAQSKQAGGAAMDMALGLGQDIFSMSQQLARPGPTGSIQMPQPGQNPRLSALLGQLYRG